MINHERVVLATVLKSKEKLVQCINKIDSSYFLDKNLEIIFNFAVHFFKTHKKIVSSEIFSDSVSRSKKMSQEEKNKLSFLCDELMIEEYEDEKFLYSLDKIIEEKQNNVFNNYFEKAVDEFNIGNLTKTRQIMKDAEREVQKYDASIYQEGDILSKAESEKTWIDVEEKRKKFEEKGVESVTGIFTGIKKIDDATLGILNTEFWVFAGWTGDGKTQTLKEIAYHAAVKQKKNVVVATLEMKKDEWKSLIYTRHSHYFYQDAYGTGIDNRKIMFPHLLSHDELKAYKQTLDDFNQKEGKEYGKIYIYTPESRHSIADVENKALSIEEMFHVDLIIIDYLSILDLIRPKNSDVRVDRETQWRDTKMLALTFHDKQGIPIATAHQVKQVAWERAKDKGYYILNDLADTVASSRNANCVAWVLRTDDDIIHKELTVGVAKLRRGGTISPFKTKEFFERSLIGNLEK